MLRVTIELVSAIAPNRSRVLGIAEIANDLDRCLQTAGRQGSYSVRLSKWAPKQSETWKTGKVANFDRRFRGPWDLLYLALKAIVGPRNKEGATP